jgi:hypothetical protein
MVVSHVIVPSKRASSGPDRDLGAWLIRGSKIAAMGVVHVWRDQEVLIYAQERFNQPPKFGKFGRDSQYNSQDFL